MGDRLLPDAVNRGIDQPGASSLLHDKKQVLAGMLSWAILTLILFRKDYIALGNGPDFVRLLLLRLGFGLATLLIAWLLFYSTSQRKLFNYRIILWGVLAVLVYITFYQVNPDLSESRYLLDLVGIFSFYFFIPSSLVIRVLPPLLFTFYDITLIITGRSGIAPDMIWAFVISFSAANFIGLALSVHSRSTENFEQKARQNEALIRAELERLAATDPLTGVYNRRRLLEVAGEAFARFQRYNRPVSLLMLDLDGFKQVNDTFGHQQGDATLVEFTRMVAAEKREADSLGRMGGDEFCLVLPETNISEAARLAGRILRRCAGLSFNNKCALTLVVSVSIGIAEALPKDPSLDSLLARADAGLYNAKNTGKNRWAVAHELPRIVSAFPSISESRGGVSPRSGAASSRDSNR